MNTSWYCLDGTIIEAKYLDAVDKILAGLADSDFITNAGSLALGELRQYRIDMARDLQLSLTSEGAAA